MKALTVYETFYGAQFLNPANAELAEKIYPIIDRFINEILTTTPKDEYSELRASMTAELISCMQDQPKEVPPPQSFSNEIYTLADIRFEMTRQHLSQRQLAKIAHVSRAKLCQALNGKITLPPVSLLKIQIALKLL